MYLSPGNLRGFFVIHTKEFLSFRRQGGLDQYFLILTNGNAQKIPDG